MTTTNDSTFERAASAPLRFVELEETLVGDPAGVELRALVDRLTAGKQRVQAELDRGVSSERHARLSALARAYDSGLTALPKLWEDLNKGEN